MNGFNSSAQDIDKVLEKDTLKVVGVETKPLSIPKVELGIELIDIQGSSVLVCQCGASGGRHFNKFVSKTTFKDAKGRWSNGEKLYLMCNKCKTVTDYTPAINLHLMSNSGFKPKLVKPNSVRIYKPTKKQALTKKNEHKMEKKNKRAGRK